MNPYAGIANICTLVGRVLLALLFLISGVGLIGAFSVVTADMAVKDIPVPDAFLGLTIALWLSGGVCLFLGWKARPFAGVMFLAMIPITFVFHAPWASDPSHFQNELNHFLMNLAIMGGLLQIVGFGAGSFSLDDRRVADSSARNS